MTHKILLAFFNIVLSKKYKILIKNFDLLKFSSLMESTHISLISINTLVLFIFAESIVKKATSKGGDEPITTSHFINKDKKKEEIPKDK